MQTDIPAVRETAFQYLPGMRFNDGRCDRQGRFWAGTMVMNMAATAKTAPCRARWNCCAFRTRAAA